MEKSLTYIIQVWCLVLVRILKMVLKVFSVQDGIYLITIKQIQEHHEVLLQFKIKCIP